TLDDQEDGVKALDTLLEHDRRTHAVLEARGNLPGALPALREEPDTVRETLSRNAVVELQKFGSEELGSQRLPLSVTPGFGGKLKPLAQQAGVWAKQGRAVVIVSQQALRLADLLDEEGIAANLVRKLSAPPEAGTVTLLPLALSGGFSLRDELAVIS